MALYQQLREYRDAINSQPKKREKPSEKILAESKSTQTYQITCEKENDKTQISQGENDIALPQYSLETRAKRLPSSSPKHERSHKRQKTVDKPNNVENNEDCSSEDRNVADNNWKQANSKKKNKKRKKGNLPKETGEALTIRAKDSKTYAEMLKQLKTKINPTEYGVEVNEMRRTKSGELLIKLKRGDGQTDKLKEALQQTLGEEVEIRSATRTINVDIRDMDESTEEYEIIEALMQALEVQQETHFKILNIREYYGKTKQALVQIPINLATKLLTEGKIRIGWIRCRVRAKNKIIKCYKCLDQGHMAKYCKGIDRSILCRKCCNTGHRATACNEQPRCILCQEAGLKDIGHYIGCTLCVANRRNIQSKND